MFAREEAQSQSLMLWPLTSGHFSYARCFRWVFAMFTLVGLAIAFASIAFAPP